MQGVIDVNQLNLAKANQRQAFLKALEERPAILSTVSKVNEEHFFNFAIKKNPTYFVHLNRNQYTDTLAQILIPILLIRYKFLSKNLQLDSMQTDITSD